MCGVCFERQNYLQRPRLGFFPSNSDVVADSQVAVSLFGCRAEKNPNKFPGIFNLQELGQPSAGLILDLDRHIQMWETFSETYGIMEDFRMVDAFWNCSTLFQTSTKVKQSTVSPSLNR